jgi:hypothetical protein
MLPGMILFCLGLLLLASLCIWSCVDALRRGNDVTSIIYAVSATLALILLGYGTIILGINL